MHLLVLCIHKTGCQLYIQYILFVNKADREKEIKKEKSMLKHHQPNHSTKNPWRPSYCSEGKLG